MHKQSGIIILLFMSELDTEKQNRRQLVHVLLNMAEGMLLHGAEIYRVEDTITRMGKAAGAVQMNVFVITSSIVLTVVFADREILTETRRITVGSSNDFTCLEELNRISRQFCNAPVSPEELQKKIDVAVQPPASDLMMYIGSILAAGAFAVFFGGNIGDGIAAGLLGVLIGWMQKKIRWVFPNTVSFNIVCAFVIGCLIGLLTKAIPFLHFGMIMIGDIMLLIPGVATTVSIRDVLVGDTISGTLRLIECLLLAVALAYGFVMAIMLTGGAG